MIDEFNSKGPVNYEHWIDSDRIIIPCMRGIPIVKDWTNPNFKITKEEWRNNYSHCEIALRLDQDIDLDIDNEFVKRFEIKKRIFSFYNQEIKEGDEVDVFISYFDHDNKRLHYKLEMYDKNKNTLSATTEILALYIDLIIRKVTEFEPEKIKIMNDYILNNKKNFNKEGLKFLNKIKKEVASI